MGGGSYARYHLFPYRVCAEPYTGKHHLCLQGQKHLLCIFEFREHLKLFSCQIGMEDLLDPSTDFVTFSRILHTDLIETPLQR